MFDEIRQLYTQLPESKARGYKPGRFSFNVSGGRCEACEGNGSNKLEMDFLADVWVTCPVCEGHRFNRETLQVRFKGKSIAQVLEMDIQEALQHFENIPAIHHKLQTLHDVGLDYMKLGQPSPTLSGGEAQRVKLARELVKKSTGRTLYLLDEPTTGLHFADIQLLLKVLHAFVDAGNTVLVVEHNMEVIKTADWIIDLGPGRGRGGRTDRGRRHAGGGGGEQGKREGGGRRAKRPVATAARGFASLHRPSAAQSAGNRVRSPLRPRPAARCTARPPASFARFIKVRGARQHNLKGVDVDIPRDAADRLLRAERIGQDLAGHGHDLRRGPAALRRKPQRLRPAVRRPDAEAEGRPHRGPFAGHGHRAEAFGPHAAEHGGHGHRDLRLPADSHVAAGPAVLPGLRRAHRQPVGRRDHRQDHGPSGRARSCT